MNVDKENRSPDYVGSSDAEVQLNVWPYLERRRVAWVIIPKDAARVLEDELLSIAKKYGKIKLHAEESAPPKPAGQN